MAKKVIYKTFFGGAQCAIFRLGRAIFQTAGGYRTYIVAGLVLLMTIIFLYLPIFRKSTNGKYVDE